MPLFDLKEGRGEAGGERKMLELPIDAILPNPSQPRATFDEESIRELAQSIQQVGLIQPPVVRRVGSGYELVAGERRLRACKSLGMQTVTCIVQQAVENEASAMMALIENLQREDLHFLEEAQCYEDLLTAYGLTQEQLAARLGKSQSAIANKLRVLRLSEPVKGAMKQFGLSERHARALLRLKGDEAQMNAIKKIADKNLSVKETEKLVDKTLDKLYDAGTDGAKPRPKIVRLVKDYRLFMNTINAAINQLRESGMKVEVDQLDVQDGVDIHIQVRR